MDKQSELFYDWLNQPVLFYSDSLVFKMNQVISAVNEGRITKEEALKEGVPFTKDDIEIMWSPIIQCTKMNSHIFQEDYCDSFFDILDMFKEKIVNFYTDLFYYRIEHPDCISLTLTLSEDVDKVFKETE